MEIILFRHGIAEPYNSRGDAERELTDEGIKKVKRAAKGLPYLIQNRRKVFLYSSPLRRARQTAYILENTLKMQDRYLRDQVCEGTFEELYAEWTDYSGDATVIVVGHEPTLGAWLERITNEKLAIAKAAACAVGTRDLFVHASGKLLWYLPADVLARIGKNAG